MKKKVTRKQQQEIDFLTKHFCDHKTPSVEEIQQYIQWTVTGANKDSQGTKSKNILFQAKRRLDMNIKMWTPDLRDGMLGVEELLEDYSCPYFIKIMKTTMKTIIKSKICKADKLTGGLAFANRHWALVAR